MSKHLKLVVRVTLCVIVMDLTCLVETWSYMFKLCISLTCISIIIVLIIKSYLKK